MNLFRPQSRAKRIRVHAPGAGRHTFCNVKIRDGRGWQTTIEECNCKRCLKCQGVAQKGQS